MRRVPDRLEADVWLGTGRIRLFHDVYQKVPLHWHEFYELSFIVGGKGLHYLNGKELPAVAGSMFLLSPVDFHALVPMREEPFTIFNIIFSADDSNEDVKALLTGVRLPQATVLDPCAQDQVLQQYLFAENEQHRAEWGVHTMLAAALQCLLVMFLRAAGKGGAGGSDAVFAAERPPIPLDDLGAEPVPPWVASALNYIHSNFRRRLLLEEVAQQVGLSPAYLSGQFHRATGMTFQDYVQRLRIDFAVRLLTTTRLSATEVCFASGFQSFSHFAKTFRKLTGRAPGAYRICAHQANKR
jgi:AraC-like DNA-binding protein